MDDVGCQNPETKKNRKRKTEWGRKKWNYNTYHELLSEERIEKRSLILH